MHFIGRTDDVMVKAYGLKKEYSQKISLFDF